MQTRTALTQDLNTALNTLIKELSSLDEDQLNKVPFEGSWTAGQLGYHLLKSYGAANILAGNTATTERAPDEKLHGLREVFLNFDIKMQSPDFIVPPDEHIDKARLIKGLRERARFMIDFASNPENDLSLTCLDFELPQIGLMTRCEWIGFVTVHTQRHLHQLKTIIS